MVGRFFDKRKVLTSLLNKLSESDLDLDRLYGENIIGLYDDRSLGLFVMVLAASLYSISRCCG